MAIEDILRSLEEQASADIDAVLTEAAEHAALIEQQAQEEALRIRRGYENQVERVARGEASKVVNAARLASKMAVSTARGEGVDQVFSQASAKLTGLRSQSDYDELLSRLAAEAFEDLSGEVVVHVDPADSERAERELSASQLDGSIETDLVSLGGLVVESAGGRVVRRNTLEDRLERVRQFVQSDVAKVLFS